MKKKFALSFVALASVALLAACGEVKSGASNTTGNPVDEKTIKIGFNFEETGAVAAYGTAEQKGAQLAVDEINAAGGIDGKQIEVVDKDNKSETAEAASVTTNLVTQSKVAAIVGPATSGATAAAVANATKAGVPLISPSATQDGLTKGQDYLFIGTFQDSFQGKIISNYVTNKLNAKNIADYFKSQQRKVDINTIYNYLDALNNAFVIQRIPRYDIKGKEILQTNEKYFVSDLSLIYSVMGYRDRLIGGMLENLVCMELKRRGYEVYVGKQDEKEVDFVAIRREEKIYVQVTYQLGSQATIDREFAPLLAIDDHYPKYVVSMDDLWQDNIEGVKHRHIADFLLDEW